ncbi:MAG: hypothetical protein JO336_01890 [Acidobacteriia bacterium]|nr:hypothetical protein [Terriglobia bacterium]MBV8902408.1 hypothetical protein [Terriglobia bacterium]
MPRSPWVWLIVLWPALLFTCRRSANIPDLLPSSVGAWHRTAFDRPSVSDAPDPVPRSAIEQFQSATYEGAGKLEARVYALDAPAVALELTQRWRPSADTVFFNQGRYFVVVKWQDADRKALQAFVADLQMRLGKPIPGKG